MSKITYSLAHTSIYIKLKVLQAEQHMYFYGTHDWQISAVPNSTVHSKK